MSSFEDRLLNGIQNVSDFPKPGVVFKDIMPIFLDAALFHETIQHMAKMVKYYEPTHIVGVESRGFLFGLPLAYALGACFLPARKKGKLPGPVISHQYDLEYGTDTIEIQKIAANKQGRYLIVDDVLATGGTAQAVNEIMNALECSVVANLFLLEIGFLKGRENLAMKAPSIPVLSILKI